MKSLTYYLIVLILFYSSIFAQEVIWKQTSGPVSGDAWSFARNSNGQIFVGSIKGFTFRSDNDGKIWNVLNSGEAPSKIQSLLIPDGNTLFAGTSKGIFKSTNSGETWIDVSDLTTNMGNWIIQALGTNSSGDILVGIGGDHGIYKSTDDGENWNPANNGLTLTSSTGVEGFALSNNGVVYSSIYNSGIYLSNDDGNTWNSIGSGLPATTVYDLVCTGNSNLLVAVYGHGIYKTTDDGTTWQAVNNGISNLNTKVLSISPNGNLLCGNDLGEVYLSTDEGQTWNQIDQAQTNTRISSLFAFGSPEIFLMGTLGEGIFRSLDNGSNWDEANDGFVSSRIYDLEISTSGTIFSATQNRIFTSGDGGNVWEHIKTGLPNYEVLDIAISNNNDMIFAATKSGLAQSTNGGNTWSVLNNGIPSDFGYYSVIVNNNNGHVFATKNGAGIYRSTDSGNTWDTITEGIPFNSSTDIVGLAIDNSGILYVAFFEEGIYRSDNNGDSWYKITNGLTSPYVTCLAVSNEGAVFTGFGSDGIYRSNDGGTNWEHVFQGGSAYVASLNFNSQGHIFAGTIRGVLRSIDNGKSWDNFDIGFPENTSLDIITLCTDNFDYIYVGTLGFGVYKTTNSTTLPNPSLTTPEDNAGAVPINLFLSWENVGEASEYELQVSTTSDFSNFIVNQKGITATSMEVTDLNHEMQYFWRVRAWNNFSVSGWSEIFTFTTYKEGPGLIYPGNNVTGVSRDVTLEWNSLSSAVEYHLQVSTDISFSSSEHEYNQLSSTSHFVQNLAYSTTYYWHVRALLSDDIYTDWSEIRSFRTILAPINLINPENEITDVEFPITFSWNGEPNASSYWLQISIEDDFDPVVFDDSNISLTNHQIAFLDFNTQYFWRVAGMDNGIAGEWSEIRFFYTQPYSTTINVDTSIYFPDYNEPRDYQATDYRLIGLPGNSEFPLEQIFGQGYGEQWIAYFDEYDQENNKNTFVKFSPDDDRFKFYQGLGFWILNKGQKNIKENVTSAIINDQNQAHITLQNGWNIITNPFPFTVSWQAVCDLNELGSLPLYKYNGGFNNSSMLDPFQGYYIDNQSNRADIFVPYIKSMPKVTAKMSDLNWHLNIILNSGKFEDSATWLGVSDLAEVKIDHFDYRKPRAIGKIPRVYFNRSEWGEKWASMTSDIRPEIEEKEIWVFDVDAPAGQKARLSFYNVENIPAEFDVYLIDRSKLRTIDLRLKNEYTYTPVTDHSKFTIIIGNESAVKEELQSVIPKEFVLGNNYPNPFNPETVIPIELPEAVKISLKIYNILGEEVRTLFHGPLETGRHQFTWDGTNHVGQRCPSGIYLYHMEGNNGFKVSRRMILMK